MNPKYYADLALSELRAAERAMHLYGPFASRGVRSACVQRAQFYIGMARFRMEGGE